LIVGSQQESSVVAIDKDAEAVKQGCAHVWNDLSKNMVEDFVGYS
jgi:hypothetical protein